MTCIRHSCQTFAALQPLKRRIVGDQLERRPMQPWEIVLERFAEFGRAPTKEKYLAQFDPAMTLFHPGMAAPIGLDQIPEFIDKSLSQWTDYRHTPIYWAVNGETMFVETANSAQVGDRKLTWSQSNIMTIKGEHIVRGRSNYDRAEVFAQVDPAGPAKPNAHVTLLDGATPMGASASDDGTYVARLEEAFVRPYIENWKHPDPQRFKDFYASGARMINPGFERAIGPDELAEFYINQPADHPGVNMRLENWAAAPGGVLFFEWAAQREVGGRLFEFPVVDRFRLNDMLAVDAVAYYDLMSLEKLVLEVRALETAA
jgi:limonene-1,2-epoxide hydrolase